MEQHGFMDMNMNDIDENMTVPYPHAATNGIANDCAINQGHLVMNYPDEDMQPANLPYLQPQPQPHVHMQQHQQHQPQIHQHQHHHHHHHQQQYIPHPQQHQQQQQNYYQDLSPLIQSNEASLQQGNQKVGSSNHPDELARKLMILNQKTLQTEVLLKKSCGEQEELTLQVQHKIRLQQAGESLNIQDIRQAESIRSQRATADVIVKQIACHLNHTRNEIFVELCNTYDNMRTIQEKVLGELLPAWHREQQESVDKLTHSANSSKVDKQSINKLNHIENLVKMLGDITWRMKAQLSLLLDYINQPPTVSFKNLNKLKQLLLGLDESLETLVLNTFVVERQPPQVMKTNTRFNTTVRFMSGPRLIGRMSPDVKAIILSESNARALIKRRHEMIRSSWDFSTPNGQEQQQLPQQVHSPPNQHLCYTSMPQDILLQEAPKSDHPNVRQQATQQEFFQQQAHPPASFQQAQTSSPPPMLQYQQPPTSGNINYRQKILNIDEYDSCSEILNNKKKMEYHEQAEQMLCTFGNMALKKIKRTEKKGTESVMDEKFVLVYHCKFRIADNSSAPDPSSSYERQSDLWYQIIAISLPVVVIVHGNQEPHAWATITWHNAFARPDGILYHIPDKVTWLELGQVLSGKFHAWTGRGLDAANLKYLSTKACRSFADNNDDVYVTWNQFAKECLTDRTFTFWEWFYSILKLTKEHLLEIWAAGRIYGFVGKNGSCSILLGNEYHSSPAPVGTFLLRFSETELGRIAIAWIPSPNYFQNIDGPAHLRRRHSPTNSTSSEVEHMYPYGSKDLATRSLADRIRDLKELIYLHPDIPKDEAFRKHYTPIDSNRCSGDGYVRNMLIETLVTNYKVTLEANSNDNPIPPPTPSSYSQSSSDGTTYADNVFMSEVDSSYPAYEPQLQ